MEFCNHFTHLVNGICSVLHILNIAAFWCVVVVRIVTPVVCIIVFIERNRSSRICSFCCNSVFEHRKNLNMSDSQIFKMLSKSAGFQCFCNFFKSSRLVFLNSRTECLRPVRDVHFIDYSIIVEFCFSSVRTKRIFIS